jgi:SLT domain-containing protein
MAIAQAIISTYDGAQKSYSSLASIPYVGPALGIAAAIAAIGAGMARVSAIRATEYQGRAAGGSVIGGQPYMVGERGPELIIPHGSGGTVIPNNRLGGMMGGSGITYNGPYIANLSAIDTQSAAQFLAKNKEMVWAANVSAQRSMPSSR